MIKAISDLNLPTVIKDIIEDYCIDLREHSVNYSVSSGCRFVICVYPHAEEKKINSRYDLSKVEQLSIARDWSHDIVDARKRTVVSKAFIYQYIRHNSINTLVKNLRRNYTGETYVVDINGKPFTMPVSLYNKLCSWIMDDHFVNRMRYVRDDLSIDYDHPRLYKILCIAAAEKNTTCYQILHGDRQNNTNTYMDDAYMSI